MNPLEQRGRLDEDEWLEMKRHPEIGYRILSSVNDMSDLAEYVLAIMSGWMGRLSERTRRRRHTVAVPDHRHRDAYEP